MRRSSSLLALSCCLGLLGLSACNPQPGPADPADPADPAEPANAVSDAGSDSEGMRYTCDGGYAVVILGETARVSAAGGDDIQLRRVADMAPPVFAGEAMEFAVESDGAVLNQDEGGRRPCRESDR
ncbi:MAG: hypothetical protein H0T88_09535 [Lysobacter sp.]|nr:hypothetical protein [Lysobacter sp.]